MKKAKKVIKILLCTMICKCYIPLGLVKCLIK